MKIRSIPALLPVLLLSAVALAAELKVEPIAGAPAGASVAMTAALQTTGSRVLAAGSPLAEIWLRKEVPPSGKKEVEGANYPALTPGMLVGVITLLAANQDFRSQPLKPGAYALRYELLPNDGNHMGVAPDRDFLLLVPLAEDPGPAKILSYPELVKLSSRAAGSGHPAVLSMPAPNHKGGEPVVYSDENGYLIFSASLTTTAGPLPLAVIVRGVSMSL